MSRTDVHRPWAVQLADPRNRHLLYRYTEWGDGMARTSWRNLGCGCRMCTGHDERRRDRRRERRRERAAGRRKCRNWNEETA